MKFTLSWLKDHLETEAGLDEIVARLTAIGLEVEGADDPAREFAAFTVARVVEARQHPNADRLRVCLVDTGSGTVQVVCGAPNARTGMKGVFAPAGSRIPGTGLDLKASKIRGVESNGMLCSEREMGLSDEHEGIIDLPDDAEVGRPFAEVYGLDDPVIEVAVTPNRQDCLGVIGIARDLAATGLGKLKPFRPAPVPGVFESPVTVSFDFTRETASAATCFVGRYFRGLKNGPSPDWMQRRLRAIGLRPISALVDITNYVTFDLGRPLHVFDADKIEGDIVVRLARPGERLLALNGRAYELDAEMTVIADARRPEGLAGVMGGEASGCTEGTVNMVLEVALFDPLRTAATGRKLAIESDARYRFERGLDPAMVVPGAEEATRLILEFCGGEVSELFMAGSPEVPPRAVELRPGRVAGLGGLAVDEARQRRILSDLGFTVAPGDGGAWRVGIPTWRTDVEGEADLVEEITRIVGYDAIPSVPLPRTPGVARPVLSAAQRRVPMAKRTLAARGMVECVTWSFLPRRFAALFRAEAKELLLANPISSELDAMRPSLLPNLISAAGRNLDRGFADLALFEVGDQFLGERPEDEARIAAGIRRGATGPRHWSGRSRPVDALDARADAEAVLAAIGAPVANLQVLDGAPAWYHPGRSGALGLGPGKMLAWFGEISPLVLKDMDVEGPAVGFEVRLDAVPPAKARRSRSRPPLQVSDLPAVERDFAFVVDAGLPAQELLRAVRGAERALIAEATVFDVYQGEGIEAGKKSVAVTVRLEPAERTLTEPEIEAVAERIVAQAAKATGAKLRG